MSDLYSVIAGLQPDQQDILEAELLAKQILEANFPDLDLREGTAIRDLTLRPSAFLLALCKKGSELFFTQNTLAGVDNSTPTETLDDILGNLFLSRKTGTFATINARLFFARQKSVALTQDISFSTDGTILFYPVINTAYPASSLIYDSYQNEWYMDVDLKAAETGVAYNLSEGSLLYFTNFDPYFLHAEINYLLQSSTAAETNTQFVARAATAISTRNLINKPSIDSNLQSSFNTVPTLLSLGTGDREMYRDQVKVRMDPLAATTVAAISEASGTVTVTLDNHGFSTGQQAVIAGAVPSQYNGTYTVTRINGSTLTYVKGSSIASATVLPTIQSLATDVWIHQGGTVDVYCDDSLSTQIHQYTLSSTGSAVISGPVVKVERSSVSGGASPDTMPLAPVVSYTSEDVPNPAKFYSTVHGLIAGDVVAVTSMSQSIPIATISCLTDSPYVTVRSVGHPISTLGSLVTIQGVSPSLYNGDYVAYKLDADNFTYQVSSKISTAGAGGSMLTVNRGLLKNAYPSGPKFGTVTSATGSYFIITMPNLWSGVSITGTAIVTHEPGFTLTYPGYTSRTDATFLVDTISAQYQNQLSMPGNPLVEGRYVQVSGSSNSLNNQVWKVGTRVSTDIVNIHSLVANGFTAGTGPITVKYVNPPQDVAFSDRQTMTINYGSGHASQTVSLQQTYFPNVANVQAYLNDAENRVLCGDLLARGFDVYALDIVLTVYNTVTPSTALAQTIINNYLTALPPGSVLVVSDLVAQLTAGGIINLRTPISITSKFYQRDMFDFTETQVIDVFNPENSTAVYALNSVAISSVAV